jgi:16S rRNA (guanine966-N2)-methyltransferase|tara:strand:- start:2081 stop:2641 length:561 start_codon:yes stop_codon:yes gene_type:complete
MRIISGKFKGKKILEPKDIKTRPLKDLTKESIFNILQHSNKIKINIEKSNVLDIFSGVGSFGLECLSRGVLKVTFIENYKKVLPILKKNLDNFKSISNYKIIESNAYENNTFKILKDKFDIIFLDPPYKDDNLKLMFDFIQEENILKNEGIIILHRHKNTENEIPLNFKIIEEKKYGISKILFIGV